MAPLPNIPYNTRSAGQSSNEEGPIQSPDSLPTPPNPPVQESATSVPPSTSDLVQLRMLEILERFSTNTTSITTNSRAPETRHLAKEPDSFSGNPTELENFLTSCVLYMDCYPGTFNSDKGKINFIISHCRHKVMKSLRPLMNRAQQPELLHNYEEFLKYLRRHWGDPDEKGNAKREMRKLRQQGSASEFFLKFNQLVAILGWSPDSEILVENAIDKLAGELKDEIVRQGELEVSSIDQLMDFVVPLDNRLREREKEKRELQASTQKFPRNTNPNMPKHSPSQNATGIQTNNPPPHRIGPLSSEEKDRRRANKLCMYCGDAGHPVDTCPKKGKDSARRG